MSTNLDKPFDPKYDDPANYPSYHDDRYPPDWENRKRRAYKRDDYTCQRCGLKSGPHAGDDGVPVHAHHIVPLSEGGTNDLQNLVTLCEDCHNSQHDHDITADETYATQTSGRTWASILGRFPWTGNIVSLAVSGLIATTLWLLVVDILTRSFPAPINLAALAGMGVLGFALREDWTEAITVGYLIASVVLVVAVLSGYESDPASYGGVVTTVVSSFAAFSPVLSTILDRFS